MERRQLVDRRRGTERRSTLDRRGRAVRMRASESPSEHLRNALQLLAHVSGTAELTAAPRADFDAAMQRLEEALRTLERRASKTDRA